MSSEDLKPCLFLDRDGVLVRNVPYMHKTEDVEIIPEVAKLVAKAKNLGWLVIVVTNQSGIAREYFTAEDCENLNAYIDEQIFNHSGGKIDHWEYCPDKEPSPNRKPSPGMVLRACKLFPVDLQRSIMVGDNLSDLLDLPELTCVLVQSDRDISHAPEGTKVFKTYTELCDELLDCSAT